MYLYEELNGARKYGGLKSMPEYIATNLNPRFELRLYQKQAFENFVTHFESDNRQKPTQVLFHMATGSGKTLIMAGLILYLYKQGYRNFLFFVNLTNIVEKTRENFLNPLSSKYLFADEIVIAGEKIRINVVENFQYSDNDAINICFSTTQGLHTNMWLARENGMTYDDFNERKVVLISDEAHHLNVDTRRMTAEEKTSYHSWEETVKYIFKKNTDNVLLEFTATCDLENLMVRTAYENKIIFDYPLAKFYNDKYSKDIITFRSNSPVMDRALQALIISQYRLKVFQDNRLSIKPIVLFKAAKISASEEFMVHFLNEVRNLTGRKLNSLASTCDNEIMRRAIKYFSDNGISPETLAAELRDDFSEEHCISVNSDSDASKNQILLNSLEDADNPYRAIFEVKKLDEGWDVLNLFDIVRLYETRQSGGRKISPVTIAEAQLIGRGARYCPFKLNDEQSKFQRKYDEDVACDLRVCETLYYHCQNDSRYVAELKSALREIGLDTDKIVKREYILKETFKAEDFYKYGVIFLNDRKIKDRKFISEIMSSIREKTYDYKADKSSSGTDNLMSSVNESNNSETALKPFYKTIKEIATVNYAIVNKALMKYPIYKFSTLKSYFPNLKSTRQFITDDEYLGNISIIIRSTVVQLDVHVLYDAVLDVFGKIADVISKTEETYLGTKEFKAKKISDIFQNKTVNYFDPHDEGVGVSQNAPLVSEDLKIDLSLEDWFVYTDNYGTSEEKAFVAYFRDRVEALKKIYNKIYLIRNERAFCIYSFEDGKRFEPDYVLFLQKGTTKEFEQLQIFIEPKGSHLLEKDSWKEHFLLQLKSKAIPVKIFVDDNSYKIWGFHFFNQDNPKDFNSDFKSLL